MTTGDYVDNAINHLYDTEIDPLKAALAARDAVIRELVEAGDKLHDQPPEAIGKERYDTRHAWVIASLKALTLINDTPAKQGEE